MNRLCDPQCGDCTHVLNGHFGGVTCVEWSPTEQHILASGRYVCVYAECIHMYIYMYIYVNTYSYRFIFIHICSILGWKNQDMGC
jgi:WD40 repeat protein